MKAFTIMETPVFTEWVTSSMSDDSYRSLQISLLNDPAHGRVVKGGGGVRKMRWGTSARGKRGGLRIIYYLALSRGQILILGRLVKEEFK